MNPCTQHFSNQSPNQKKCLQSILDLIGDIEDTPKQLVVLLFGVHGSEARGSFFVARNLASSISHLRSESGIKLIGPISPWSCRNDFRYDRYLGDPNRIYATSKPKNTSELAIFWELWQKLRPTTQPAMIEFLQLIAERGIDMQTLFQSSQDKYPGIPGYVHQRSQQRRLSFLKHHIERHVRERNASSLAMIDVHTGVGEDAWTHVYYRRSCRKSTCKYMVDHLAAMLQDSLSLPVDACITETGVVSNGLGMIDCLSELAHRTYGYAGQRNMQGQAMNLHWQSRTQQFLAMITKSRAGK